MCRRRSETHILSPGDQVLALLPVVTSPFQAKFVGPCTVVRQVSDQNYVISTPHRKRSTQLCHINFLKPYFSRTSTGAVVKPAAVAVPFEVADSFPIQEDEKADEIDVTCCMTQGRLKNSEALSKLESLNGHLSAERIVELCTLIRSYYNLFSDVPSRTHLVKHDIEVGDSAPICQRFYRSSLEKREQLESEVKYMLEHGIAVPSHSSWASPCLLVAKPDQTFRPCTDFRKVNAITKPDSYPLPRMEDCVDQVGSARFVSKFDRLKGYWQIPLTPRAQEIVSYI